MFPVIVNDGTQEIPSDDICYIVAKEGIFLKKKMGVMESIAPVKNISILDSVETMARMHINPIPAQWGAKILSFFRAVYDKFHSEAIVLLFYNEETGKYKIVPPHQKVTAAACDYNRGVTVEGFTMIGTIHSHGSMSAFHSGTDDSDENSFDGLHITYGNVIQDEPSISASIVANGHRFMVKAEDYMDGLVKTKEVDKTENKYTTKIYKWVNGKMELDEKASSRGMYAQRTYDKRFTFNVSETQARFNQKWMKMVERGTYTYYGNYGVYGAYDGWRGGNYWARNVNTGKWGSNYDPNAWKNRTGYVAPANQKQLTGQAPPTTVEPPKCDSKNPCLSCKHREIKVMDEMNGLVYEEEMYLCEGCGTILTTAEDDVVCPKCKTADKLELIEEKDLKDNQEVGDPIVYKPVRAVVDDIDREAALNSAQSIEQPDQRGYETCPQCTNTFLRLATDECCPFCQTLLPEDTDEELEWQCPYCSGVFGESEVMDDNKCPHCYGMIELTEENALIIEDDDNYTDYEIIRCPSCGVSGTKKGFEEIGCCYSCHSPFNWYGEEDRIQQAKTDSGEFLHQTDEEHQAIIDAAAEADKNLERIPDPEQNQPRPLTTKDKILAGMRKVFGGGNDTIH